MVQGGSCEVDSCTVQVMPPPIATRAAYSCEVSTEGPKFQIARQTKHMTVAGEFWCILLSSMPSYHVFKDTRFNINSFICNNTDYTQADITK